jgi:hypothetical protein
MAGSTHTLCLSAFGVEVALRTTGSQVPWGTVHSSVGHALATATVR